MHIYVLCGMCEKLRYDVLALLVSLSFVFFILPNSRTGLMTMIYSKGHFFFSSCLLSCLLYSTKTKLTLGRG